MDGIIIRTRRIFLLLSVCLGLVDWKPLEAITYDATGANQSYMFASANLNTGTADAYLGNISFGAGGLVNFAQTVTSTLGIAGRFAAQCGNGGILPSPYNVANFPIIALTDDLETETSSFWFNYCHRLQGNGHTLFLGGTFYGLGNSSNLYLYNAQCAPYTANLIVDGRGNTFIGGYSTSILLDSKVSLTLRNMDIFCWGFYFVQGRDETSCLTLDNVRIFLNAPQSYLYTSMYNYVTTELITNGRLYIENEVTIAPANPYRAGMEYPAGSAAVFRYVCSRPIVITPGSQLTIGSGTTLQIDSSSINQSIVMADSSSSLCFDNASFLVPQSLGATILGGRLLFKNLVYLINTGATTAGQGIVLGDGINYQNDVDVRVHGGATVIVDGYLKYNSTQFTASYGGLTFNVDIYRDAALNILKMVLTQQGTSNTITLDSFNLVFYNSGIGIYDQTVQLKATSSLSPSTPVNLGCWPGGTGFLLAAPPPGAWPVYCYAGYTLGGGSDSLDASMGYSSGTGIAIVITKALLLGPAFPGV